MPNIHNTQRISLPRARIKMSNGDIVDHFRRLGYYVKYDDLFFSTEQIADFREARNQWRRVGSVQRDEDGLLILRDAQPVEGQPTRDIAVVSLGSARAVMGVFSQRERPAYYKISQRMD